MACAAAACAIARRSRELNFQRLLQLSVGIGHPSGLLEQFL